MFQEITVQVEGEDEIAELMFDIDPDTGKLTGIYTWTDNNLIYVDYEKDKEIDLFRGWKQGKNTLFKHCPKNTNTYKRLLSKLSTIIVYNDEDEEESELIHKCYRFYGINLHN